MNETIYTANFLASLPPALKNDQKVYTLAQVIAEQRAKTIGYIPQTVIYARIDQLPEAALDVLAYDLKVDWYDYGYPLEVKRSTIKNAMKVHRKKGTKYAVETALGDVFPGTRVEEWFEYNGEPFMFRVIIGASTAGVSKDQQDEVLAKVKYYKNLRSHLEAISYRVEQTAVLTAAACVTIRQNWTVEPRAAQQKEG